MIGGADVDRVALGDEQLADGAGERRRQLDQRLRRLDLDEHVVDGDRVAGRDLPRHDLGLGQALADIGEEERLDVLIRHPFASADEVRQ